MATTTTRTTLQYLEQVETFFLAQRGRGLMVSPADAQFLGELELRGVPVEVVCRGVARAFAAKHGAALGYGDHAPRSLRGCQGHIEQEIESWRARDVGRNEWSATDALSADAPPPPPPDHEAALRRLEALRLEIERQGKAAAEPQRAYYRRAWRHVKDLHTSVERDGARAATLASALSAMEARLLGDLYAQLAPIEQIMLRRRAEARIRLDARTASPKAVAEQLRLALEAELRHSLQLVPLTGGER